MARISRKQEICATEKQWLSPAALWKPRDANICSYAKPAKKFALCTDGICVECVPRHSIKLQEWRERHCNQKKNFKSFCDRKEVSYQFLQLQTTWMQGASPSTHTKWDPRIGIVCCSSLRSNWGSAFWGKGSVQIDVATSPMFFSPWLIAISFLEMFHPRWHLHRLWRNIRPQVERCNCCNVQSTAQKIHIVLWGSRVQIILHSS